MPLTAESNLDEEDSVIMDNEDNDDMSIELIHEVRSPPSPTRTSSPIEPSTSSSQY